MKAAVSFRLRMFELPNTGCGLARGGLTPRQKWGNYPAMHRNALDAHGKELAEDHVELQQDCGWRRFTGRCQIPAGAKTLWVRIRPYLAAG